MRSQPQTRLAVKDDAAVGNAIADDSTPPMAPAPSTPGAVTREPQGSPRRRRPIRRHSTSFAIAALTPAWALYTLVMIVPAIAVILLSLTDWNGMGAPQWVGLGNWVEFFGDTQAHLSLGVTLMFAFASLLIQLPISMALGIFISGPQRYRYVYSVIFVMPMLISTVGLSLTFAGILDPNLGALAHTARALGWDFLIQNWFGEPILTPILLLVLIAWMQVPLHMLIFQNGRRAIPDVLYESAEIDGASRIRQFFNITLPQLRQTIAVNTALILIGSMTLFDVIFVLTRGGPGDRTNVLAIQMYKVAFEQNRFGYAAVFGVLLAVLGLTMGATVMRASRFGEFESEQEGVA